MKCFKSALPLVLLATSALSLTGCETYHNSLGSMKNWFSSDTSQQTPNGPQGAVAATPVATCPAVTLVEDLAALRQFSDDTATREENRISSIAMQGALTQCRQTADGLAVTLKITFEGDLGPKGTSLSAASYPFFVAVTQPDGSIKSKELHTLNINYPQGQNMATVHETIQLIPAADEASAQGQQILLGFQLTDAQLVYNRSILHAENPSDSRYAAPTQSTAPAVKEEEKPKPKKKPPLPTRKPSDLVVAPVVEETPVVEEAPVEETTTPESDATSTESVPADVPEPSSDAITTETPVEETPAAETIETESVPETESAPVTDEAPAEAAPAPEAEAESVPAEEAAPVEETPSSTSLDELFDKTVPDETTTTPAQ